MNDLVEALANNADEIEAHENINKTQEPYASDKQTEDGNDRYEELNINETEDDNTIVEVKNESMI